MSSSVFVETSRPTSDSLLNGDASSVANADSNLVVVYGKNGINVDRKGLESLIDEKTLTSISVIRITSPTPSMQEEEAEEVRKLVEKNAEDDEKSDSSQDDEEEGEDSDSEDEVRAQKPTKAQVKDRPEIVGLTVEEFYPPEAAKELAKEILKYAGVTPLKCNVDYEFQRYVIKNDHCYTPYTSPSQLIKEKQKADEEDKQQVSSTRKLIGKVPTVKQYLNKRKILKDERQRKLKDKDKNSTSISDSDGVAESERQDDEAEEEGGEDVEEEESEYSEESEESAESDNDRDSDLDFDVNNRHGRKRKTTGRRRKKEKQRARSVMMQKPAHKRRLQSQDNSHEEDKISLTPLKLNRPPADLRKTVNMYGSVKSLPRKPLPEAVEAAVVLPTLPPPPPPPPVQPKPVINIQSIQVIQPPKPATPQPRPSPVEPTPLPTSFDHPKLMTSPSVPKSPQIVKELDLNKVAASPKGGFTDLSTLLARSDNMQPNLKVTEMKPEKTVPSPSSKGFMPLGIETAAKNQLPAQISIQTHQSSSEIAAENDKQSELIDSIVIPLEKSFKSNENPAIKENSIPDLVKMLESTEKAVLEKTKLSTSFAQSVEAIDIANAPLLETPDDEIPDDLLQHVVELMEGKSLQEAVEKEVLQQQQQQQQEKLQSKQVHLPPMAVNQMSLHQPVRQPQVVATPSPIRQPRSIIEASISNTPTPSSSRDTTPTPSTYKVHSVGYLRKEPIQIVRGNGRVITLPPIEAPTTRAKRRAQAQPSADTSSINDSESGDVSMHSDTSIFSEINISEKPDVVPALAPQKERTPAIKAAVGRKRKGGRVSKQQSVAAAVKSGEEEESQEDEDEDDPNKLWCICRQPHNNRFMICCDMCEDWFHGTCVSITKAMGLEMEQKGIEWTCPKCVKKQEAKKQRKITDLFDKKTLVQPMPKLDDLPKAQLSVHTALEIQAPKKPMAETKKPEPPSLFAFGKFETATKPLPRQEPATVPKTPETPEVVQKKITEFPLKKTPDAGSITPLAPGKRIIVLQSTPKSAGKTLPTKGTPHVAPMQQQTLKLTKVSTPGEKKQFVVTTKMQHHAKSDADLTPAHHHHSALPTTPLKAVHHPKAESLTCIVCKKPARANSIYCSDDCIRKHAQNALNNATKNAVKSPEPPTALATVKLGVDEKKKKIKGRFEDLLSMADRKPKVERVYVFERRTGKLLTGNNAPTTLNLKKWLQDNPTFEVVQPGSPQALEIEKSKQRARLGLQSPSNNHMFTPVKTDNVAMTATPLPPVSPLVLSSPPPLTPKAGKPQDQHKSSPKAQISPGAHPQQRSTTPKHFQKHTPQSSTKQEKPEKEKDRSATPSASSSAASSFSTHKPIKKQVSTEKEAPPAQAPARSDSSEPVRLNVRRTLKEQLMIRMNELSEDKRLTGDQVDEFVKATELEMYRLFNKDIGTKYKAKYRSLMFNIKDRKNKTLFQKICGKLIEPRQLVRLSPEEMASQELAQWRENENKHQLEMIKKSELDMLSCTKNYVLKTHKGEEVIESKSTDRVELDISIPVEDVVAVLNNSTVSSTTEIEASSANLRKDHLLELDSSLHSGQETVAAAASSSSDKRHGSSRERERDREKRHKSKDRHREKTRKRSRSRSREHRHKSNSRKDERREKEEHSGTRREHETPTKVEKPLSTTKPLLSPSASSSKPALSPKPQKEREIVKKSPKPAIEKFNLIDQILESRKTVEQAANIVHDKDTSTTATPAPNTTSAPKSKPQSPSAPDSDQEPSSTVSISTPPEDPYFKYSSDVAATMWTGPINMIDVASFSVSIQTVSGNTYMLSKDLPEELDVVGRISPDTVWDYIGKIKRSPNKEIVIIRLVPSAESENIAYTILYKYLDKRKRLGVIKTTSPNIKDFYIMPLGVGQQMPDVLHPTENFEFYEDVMRPDMLLGIVIRIMGKRHSNSAMRLQRKKEVTVISNRSVPSTLDGDNTMSFTPPGSPKPRADTSRSSVGISKGMRLPQKPSDEDDIDVDAIIKAPIAAKNNFKGPAQVPAKKDDADEPYSPGGSSDDDVQIVPLQVRDDDLKRKMDDINRRIEAQKMEIAGLLSNEQSSFGSSGSTSLAPSLANISIPSDLQQILDSIQSKPDPPPALLSPSSNGPAMVPPPPLIGSLARQTPANDEEYHPPMMLPGNMRGLTTRSDPTPSRLAQLSEAELLSMVPDDIDLDSSTSTSHKKDTLEPPLEKRPRWSEPPPPGLEGEYN